MKKTFYTACILLAGVLWGVMGLFVRALERCGFTSLQITAIRLSFGTLLLWLFVLLFARDKLCAPRGVLPVLAALGVCSVFLMSYTYFSAILYSSLSVAAILLYTAPIWVVLASAIFYREKLTAKKIIALCLAFGGCVAVSAGGDASLGARGVLFGLCAGLTYALYSIIGKGALARCHPVTVTLYAFTFASVVSLCFAPPRALFAVAASAGAHPVRILLLAAATGLVTVTLPYLFYTQGLAHIPAGKASIMASVEPAVATLAGVLVYRERPSLTAALGVAAIFAAILLLNLPIGENNS
ncbi:MAG: EamA family transporter [Clostridia bacterium]|nr:EamA family transporter [Clostridia bacterium]